MFVPFRHGPSRLVKRLNVIGGALEKGIITSDHFLVEKHPDGRISLHLDPSLTPDATEVLPGFVLFLCLDETGSIGTSGAERGLGIIDEFRAAVGDSRINGIGFVSFGDVICETYPITNNLNAARARLQTVVDSGGSDPVFFQDGGGDTPENGVDALQVAFEEILSSPASRNSQFRYVVLKTDNDGFAHNMSDPGTVLSELLAGDVISKTWLEIDGGNSGGTSYLSSFPASSKIIHGAFSP